MQHASVYLYSNRIDVYINPINSNLRETYNKVYNRNLTAVRGIDNTIEVRVKNSDQRPANIGNDVYLVFNLTDHDDQQHVFRKDCLLKDITTGIASITLTEHDLLGIDPGFYDYSIIQEKREYIESGSQEYVVTKRMPTYTDTMFDVIGTMEIKSNVYGVLQPSTTINKFSYYNPGFFGEHIDPYYISSIVNANTDRTYDLHTFQFYFDSYEGTVLIQASNDEQGATPNTWFDVDSFASAGVNEFRNVLGKYNWFRIKYIPEPDTEGKINKILYR